MSVMELIYEEIRELHDCDDSTIAEDLKERTEGGTLRSCSLMNSAGTWTCYHPETNPKKYVCRAGD